jgi:hypothetical protein
VVQTEDWQKYEVLQWLHEEMYCLIISSAILVPVGELWADSPTPSLEKKLHPYHLEEEVEEQRRTSVQPLPLQSQDSRHPRIWTGDLDDWKSLHRPFDLSKMEFQRYALQGKLFHSEQAKLVKKMPHCSAAV